MTLAEAVAIVRDQTIPALTRSGGGGHVEALRVLLADAEKYLEAQRRLDEYMEKHPAKLGCVQRIATALLLALLLPALASAQTPAQTENQTHGGEAPAPVATGNTAGASSQLAATTYAELSATSTEVTGLDTQAKNYIGSQFLAQAGWGPWALAVRARWEGLPGEFKGDQFMTYRAAEAYLSGHLNLFAAEGVTCGPAATVGYAVALEKGRPMLPHDVTAQVGLHCSSSGRTVLVQAGMWQPLPGVSATVAVIWPLSDRVSWQADWGVGARQQQVARVAVAVSIWRKAGAK